MLSRLWDVLDALADEPLAIVLILAAFVLAIGYGIGVDISGHGCVAGGRC